MRAVLKNKFLYSMIHKHYMFMWKLKHQRDLMDREKSEAEVKKVMDKIFTEPVVLNGIFEGLKYPQFRSRSSSLYAKLIGSYESELDDTFKGMFADEDCQYTEILNIGCAEGYYAVGLALKYPNAMVYAYDLEKEARELTAKMAAANGVKDRVIVEKFCGPDTLKNFKFTGRGLILSDCEGYEKELFTQENINNLKNCDLVIETHDWVDLTISTNLEKLFKPSHDIEVIQSLGDNIKAKTYSYPEIDDLDVKTRYRILEEGRRFVDEWLVLRSKAVR